MCVKKQSKQNFLQGAAILLLSMIVVKLIGAVFKMPLGNILQESGMAYFSASYNLFTTVYALTVTGLTTAVARMVAACSAKGRYRDCRNILRMAKKIFVVLGAAGTLVMLAGAKLFAGGAGLPSAVYAILVMAPAIFFSCLMATYRGYYEGLRNMIPSAVSEVVEVLAKLCMGLVFTFWVLRAGERSYAANGTVFGIAVGEGELSAVLLPLAAAGAMAGVTVSTCVGFLYLFWHYKRCGDGFADAELKNSPRPVRGRTIVNTLVKTALPITLSAVVINLTGMIDLFSVMNRLHHAIAAAPAYFERVYGAFLQDNGADMAEYIYGGYTMAAPIFGLIPSFTTLFGKSALPNITQAWVAGNRRALKINVASVFRMTSLISFPAGIGLTVLAKPIAELLYPNVEGAALTVGLPLQTLGISAVFLSLIAPLYAMLQAMGRFDLPVKFMLVGAVIKLGTNFVLVGIPQINISGAAIGTAACYAVILVFCLRALVKITGLDFHFRTIILKNTGCAVLCGAAAFAVNRFCDGRLAVLAAIAAAGVVYVAALLVLRALTEEDVRMMPGGKRLAPMMKKLHLVERNETGTEE